MENLTLHQQCIGFLTRGYEYHLSHLSHAVTEDSITGVIISAAINAPGSWHDSCVACPVFKQFQMLIPDDFYLVADTAFPCGTASIAGKIHAPLKSGEKVTGDATTKQCVLSENRQLLSYQQTAE